MSSTAVLEIENLHAGFHTDNGDLFALRGVNLSMKKGEILAVVGESGSGKTLTALSILKLLDPPAFISNGKILFAGKDLLEQDEDQLNQIRGASISMIFQEPMTALNPVLTVGYQIQEVLKTHAGYAQSEAKKRSIDLLNDVGIQNPEMRVNSYPYELSGGMRQRAMIAMALAVSPSILIADEPTTALDVTIQAQILLLLKNLSKNKNMSILLITHDLGIVSQMADNVAIMYAGQIVEYGSVNHVIHNSRHPYTQGLLNSIPDVNSMMVKNPEKDGKKSVLLTKKKLKPIRGQVPSLNEIPSGCAFRNRCDYEKKICSDPITIKKSGKHTYRCIL